MENPYEKLLRQFADSLLKRQFDSEDPSLNGGVFCPSCKVIHGRCIDAVYALCVAYKAFKDERYLLGARKLLKYSSNLICHDGGIYNDLQTTWRYTTVFFVIDLVETLRECRGVLPEDFVKELESHVKFHSRWLYENLDEHSYTNINYPINNALALHLSGDYLRNETYLKQAKHLAEYALRHITSSKLLMGEGKPHNKTTPRGCNAIDIGYNMEESLPALVKYAYYSKDEEMMKTLLEVCQAHLDFLLPDGAIDNSFGCRNYKWTYYGSRTCDGIIPMALILGKYDPRFLAASYRNLKLIEKCCIDGELSGGPDYGVHHEKACIHHTFEHANAIAFAFCHFEKDFYLDFSSGLPCDGLYQKHYPEMDSYRFGGERYLFDISCYDENIPYSGHASGATLTMLYSRKKGPLIMGSVGDYQLTEPTNMQVPLDTEHHRPLLPRFEARRNGILYSSAYFTRAKRLDEKGLIFASGLMSREGEELLEGEFEIAYLPSKDRFTLKIKRAPKGLAYILPLIDGELRIKKGKLSSKEEIFFLTPGFKALEYRIESEGCELEVEII